jgi:methane/ammonia monooxygenase subunit B
MEVEGDASAFTNQIKTLDGSVIDMETYGLANGVAWHGFWIALGSAWLLWWVRRPLFIPRYKMLHAGQEASLVSPLDRMIGAAIIFAVPMIVFGANFVTDLKYPTPSRCKPHGSDHLRLPSTSERCRSIQRAEYNVPVVQ